MIHVVLFLAPSVENADRAQTVNMREICTRRSSRTAPTLSHHSIQYTYAIQRTCTLFTLEGTVSVVSSDPPCKDGNARFTTLCLIKYELDINVLRNYYFHLWFLYKIDLRTSTAGQNIEIIRNKDLET